jgi:glutathione peroxidase
MTDTLYAFKVKDAKGADVSLSDFKNKVVLVVNVASKCGFTPQYSELQELYTKYKAQGLEIIGFPCNQFKGQEPGTDQEIQAFCSLNYEVSFPIFAKVDVNGEAAAPVYRWLKSSAPGILGTEGIKWNFTKFLVGKNGEVIERFAPLKKPASLAKEIEAALAAK